MSKIELSPDAASYFVANMTNSSRNGGNNNGSTWGNYYLGSYTGNALICSYLLPLIASVQYANSGAGITELLLMSGTPPTDLSTLTDVTALDSQVLCRFSSNNPQYGNSGDFNNVIANTNPIVIQTEYETAISSGTATWFWLVTYQCTTTNPVHQIVGTVGPTGSGADLTLPSNNITAGSLYRVANLNILFPTSWNF